MKKQYLDTGKIVSTHGVRGEVRVDPWSDSPEFLCGIRQFYLDDAGARKLEVQRARVHGRIVIVKFQGVDTMEEAQAMRGRVLYVHRDDCGLEEGEYFLQDLIGMEVRDADTGELYGHLSDVSQTGANDVYHIRAEGRERERLIPAIPQVIVRVDLEQNVMEIRPLEGLFDED